MSAACLIVAWDDRRYSVPIAAPGTPPEESVHTLTSHFQTTDLHGSSAELGPTTNSRRRGLG